MISRYLIIIGSLGVIVSIVLFLLEKSDLGGYLLSFGMVLFVVGLVWGVYENKKYGSNKENKIVGIMSRTFVVITLLILAAIAYLFYILNRLT